MALVAIYIPSRPTVRDRSPTHGYEPTREAAMAAAKSWRLES